MSVWEKAGAPDPDEEIVRETSRIFLASLSATELTFGGRFLVSNPRFSFSRSSFSPTPQQRTIWYQTPAGDAAQDPRSRLTEKQVVFEL